MKWECSFRQKFSIIKNALTYNYHVDTLCFSHLDQFNLCLITNIIYVCINYMFSLLPHWYLRISFCWYKFAAYPLGLQVGNFEIVHKKCTNLNNSCVNSFSNPTATTKTHQTLFCTFLCKLYTLFLTPKISLLFTLDIYYFLVFGYAAKAQLFVHIYVCM